MTTSPFVLDFRVVGCISILICSGNTNWSTKKETAVSLSLYTSNDLVIGFSVVILPILKDRYLNLNDPIFVGSKSTMVLGFGSTSPFSILRLKIYNFIQKFV